MGWPGKLDSFLFDVPVDIFPLYQSLLFCVHGLFPRVFSLKGLEKELKQFIEIPQPPPLSPKADEAESMMMIIFLAVGCLSSIEGL